MDEVNHHTVRDLERLFSADTTLPALAPGDLLTTAREGLVFDVVAAPADVAGAADSPPPVTVPALVPQGLALAPVPGPMGFDVRAFGARGDDRQDDTAALQHAIDTALYGPVRAAVRLPPGRFILTDTLQLGYGTTFTGLSFTGAGPVYRGNANRFAGTVLVMRKTDRPALNIQGARGTIVSGLTLLGEAGKIMADHDMGHPLRATRPDTTASDWLDPTLPPDAASRTAPYAGLTIDAYGGNTPSPAYPDVALPAFAGAQGQYGKRTSSNVQLRDMVISGFVVGVAVQPADVDANGDFTALSNLLIERCVYAVSVGNTQSRNVTIRDCKIHQVFCAFTNNTHGRQRGHFGGTIDNVSVSYTTNIFQFGSSAFAGPLTVLNLYAESTYRIGDIRSDSSNETALIVQSSVFKLGAQTDLRGIPASALSLGGTPFALRFVGCFFAYPEALVVAGGPAVFEDCRLARQPRGGVLARNLVIDRPLREALNATCGGLIVVPGGYVDGVAQTLLWRPYDPATGVRGGAVATPSPIAPSAGAALLQTGATDAALSGPADEILTVPLPIHQSTFAPQGLARVVPAPRVALGALNPLAPGDPRMAAREDGVLWMNAPPGAPPFGAPAVGDLVIAAESGGVFVVDAAHDGALALSPLAPKGKAAARAPTPLRGVTAIVTRRVGLLEPLVLSSTADHTEVRLRSAPDPQRVPPALAPGAWLYLGVAAAKVFDAPPRIVAVDLAERRLMLDRPARVTTDLLISVLVRPGAGSSLDGDR